VSGAQALATTCPEEGESLLEELLELGERTTLHEHVPVGACGLVTGVVDLGDGVADATKRFGTAGAALSGFGDVRVSGERHDCLALALSADIGVVRALYEHDAFFAL